MDARVKPAHDRRDGLLTQRNARERQHSERKAPMLQWLAQFLTAPIINGGFFGRCGMGSSLLRISTVKRKPSPSGGPSTWCAI